MMVEEEERYRCARRRVMYVARSKLKTATAEDTLETWGAQTLASVLLRMTGFVWEVLIPHEKLTMGIVPDVIAH